MISLLRTTVTIIVLLEAVAAKSKNPPNSLIGKIGAHFPSNLSSSGTYFSGGYHDEFYVPKRLFIDTGTQMQSITSKALAKTVSELHASAARWRPPTETLGIPQSSGKILMPQSKVLVLYTGGTIGMKSIDGVYQPEPHYLPRAVREIPPLNDKAYVDANFANAAVKPCALPPVRHLNKRVVYWIVEYQPLLDSSDMTFDDWIRIARDIYDSYDQYDGFVVLHGTDTMAYTTSALSFMLENLGKPVIVTGAQIPICEVRSDGRDNFIASLIIAGGFDIPEVTLYFDNKLLRGNRAVKIDNFGLDAFASPNMQPIAQMEIDIKVNKDLIFRPPIAPFSLHDQLCRYVGVLRIFPSIPLNAVRAFLRPPMQGVVLETYGAGNMPSRRTDIIAEIREAVQRGCIVINVSQCVRGQVDVSYLTGKVLYDAGAIPGVDITSEAALTKLAYVLGKSEWDLATKRKMIESNIRGEISQPV